MNFKKSIIFFFILIFFPNNLFAQYIKINDRIKNNFSFNEKYKINLPEGEWVVAEKGNTVYYQIKSRFYTLLRIENDVAVEGIFIGQMDTAGFYESYLNTFLHEAIFKNRYHGCYERPKYYIVKYYTKGNTVNCFIVGHSNIYEDIYYPEDPQLQGQYARLKSWLEENEIKLPEIALYSDHIYFSRLVSGKLFSLNYFIDPKIMNAPKSKFKSKRNSEYHQYNINNFPDHKLIMNQWLSISSKRHNNFEISVGAKSKHKINLNDFILQKDLTTNKNIVDKLKDLNNLYINGVLTKDEFEKAKKKILN